MPVPRCPKLWSKLLFLASSARAVIGKEVGQSLEHSFSAKAVLWLAFANRAKVEVRRHIKPEDETEDVKRGVDHLQVVLWGHTAIRGVAPILRLARRALVTWVRIWETLRWRWAF